MNREQITQVLYEMALVTGGETHSVPLITKTLQRLLYHTAFSCGVFISDINEVKNSQYECNLEQVIGHAKLQKLKGSIITLPEYFIQGCGGNGLITDAKCINHILGEQQKYKSALILSVNDKEKFVLLSKTMPELKLSFERIFEPILNNFNKTLRLCRENENHTALLELEIAERKKTEDEFVKAKEEAERANNAKSDFLSRMSHELRTPLNAILGFTQLIELDDSLPELTRDNLKEIRDGGHHLLTLINDVLDLAKVEAGHVDLSLEPVLYDALIPECIAMIDPIANQHNIQIYNSSSSGNIVLRADNIRIKQVIINLLSNAIKYNRRGGQVKISVNLNDNNFYRISITDTGIGIKEENLTALFEAFNRLDAENSEIEGTGIGLVITKNLVELMGGKIGVDSEYGVGSTFWIEIPKDDISNNVINNSNIEPISAQKIKSDRIYTVLYIEDNPSNLKLVMQLIEQKDYLHLFTAHTASLGLELADIKCPDLILLDINLPEMDGYKVLEKLRANNKTNLIPVVAISANAMPKDLKKSKEAGFNDYLTKPLNVQLFYETMDQFLLKK